MDQTTRSTNAYVVYKSDAAAKRAAPKLNGTMVLDRHLRADYLNEPAKIDHRRCVFVGNLSFVEEETDNDQGPDADTAQSRQRAKEPADAEEGLWRTFSKAGTIESVRVIRDKDTRVGKGIAYVQFTDENAVEAALLMHEKKFPPMLPRKLRVMRAKRTNKKSGTGALIAPKRAGPRAYKRTLRAAQAAATNDSTGKAASGSKSLIFEGARAKPTKRQAREKKKQERKAKRRYASKPKNRGSRRAAAFRADGGKTR